MGRAGLLAGPGEYDYRRPLNNCEHQSLTSISISPVLLCGGSGTRLWPLSRADMPKQLQALAHEETMLQATALRTATNSNDLQFEAPLVLAGEGHRFLVVEQLLHVGCPPRAVILEPQGRNTAPAVAIAAHWLARAGTPDALMLVMPSDHLIGNEEAFRAAIADAAPAALAGRMVTFGITPSEPATGYGYIEAEGDIGPVRRVRRFVEKPDEETAVAYVARGMMWNAGIFLFKASAYLEALATCAPEVAKAVDDAVRIAEIDGMIFRPGGAEFAACPSISIDYAVMERSDKVSVVPVDMGWSDVGSWDALWRVTAPDAEGNVVRGAGALIGCRDSLVRNEGGPFVAALGLEGMVVVATGDAVLIAPRERSEDIRKVVDRIEDEGYELTRTSHEVRRPWGSYRSLGQGVGWQVKRIAVKPGGQLSLQKHARRAETWVVASGVAIVTVEQVRKQIGPGESIFIPVGSVHRLENPGPEPLELIEVQQGGYLGEDDIVRLADVYGRTA
ncbi:mannose-1-phosphate guanylyltransferase/mannose-6-phosphate isomerase [Sandaracinobacter neustonicus]|uniref:mannose-1-phosphate guanylyltransferase n=1 Tax=Sandaracinobacter neustonicus TaxID=1715348 RepID=A0A501XT90_9SPHN|nr:mannose-1-phosphate guanylyltransferase/mannose-6-phosphate isomerase [Sandaracinobacter neustonicus]TPE63649.1 mannose-1-phosphate guanylyltransferase/mannose-6-phosphate isomerase [Sandaracinobacter neustonicus]